MVSRARDATKPTVYLDQSTLSSAYRAHSLGADRERYADYAPLAPWVEKTAHEANLCLSIVHLLELAKWSDVASADGMARWLDALPIVWAKGAGTVQADEADYWTLVAAGRRPAAPVAPFAPSLLAAFSSMSVAGVATLLGTNEPVVTIVEILRQRGGRGDLHQTLGMAKALRDDRNWAASAWATERRREQAALNRRAAIRRLALDASARMGIDEDVSDGLVATYENDPVSLPSFRVGHQRHERHGPRLGRPGPRNDQPPPRPRAGPPLRPR